MVAPGLQRTSSHGVTLLGDPNHPGGVTFAFSERTGGVSAGPYASLNVGGDCGDDPELVAQNRRLVLAALGAQACEQALVCPLQVHGDHVIVIGEAGLDATEAQRQAREGADAIVCTTPGVPVLICSADCVPLVLTAPGAFAVVHSGWRGTIAHIAAKALRVLVDAAGCGMDEVCAYVGPHIGRDDYEVSAELAQRFVDEFGADVLTRVGESVMLDLEACVTRSLVDAGIRTDALCSVGLSTVRHTDRFYSYRAEDGMCGRNGAWAFLPVARTEAKVVGEEA